MEGERYVHNLAQQFSAQCAWHSDGCSDKTGQKQPKHISSATPCATIGGKTGQNCVADQLTSMSSHELMQLLMYICSTSGGRHPDAVSLLMTSMLCRLSGI